ALPLETSLELGIDIGFSPDGRWLAASGTRTRLWSVDSWQEVTLPRGTNFAFTPDSRMLAIEASPGVLRLLETATGREVAVLEPVDQVRTTFTFNHDGTLLVATSNDNRSAVHVWDLRQVRHELKALNPKLDWDWPEFSTAPPSGREPPPRVELLGNDWAGDPRKMEQYLFEQALLTLAVNPFDASARLQVGKTELDRGRFVEAFSHLSLAIWLQPDLTAAYQERAVAGFHLQRWPRVVA